MSDMSSHTRITRREFVQTGTGLVIGFYLPRRLGAALRPAEAAFAPNAWLRVGTDGIATLTVDKSEMGQGSQTGLAMILAEELEADWSTVRLGPVPENPVGWSRTMRTGGSNAIRTSWEPLRKAGATAREMLIAAAAEAWKVDRTTCRAENGAVIHGPTRRRLPYGKLATRAAQLAVSSDVPLKDPKDFHLIGKRVPRLDTPSKVDGSAVFGIDVKVPGMLVASIERSPVLGGRVKRVNADKAKALPGVRHVVALEPSSWIGTNGAWAAGCAAGVAVVAAAVKGWASEKVRIHTTFSGGGFGRRLEPDFVSEAVRVSKAVAAPVKVIWTREDDMRNGFYRPTTYNRFAAGLDGSGRPVAWTHRIAGTPLRLKFGPLEKGLDDSLVDGAIDLPYAIPNVLVDQVVLELPAVPRGPWRSVGVSHNGFVTECFLDEVAAAAGRDPFELRRELLRDKARHRRTLELAADKAGWGTPLPAGRGRGIALAEWGPTVCAEVAEVSVDPSGTVRVHRVTCAVDCGPAVNLGQIEAQMQGGIVFGLTAALYGEITIERGRVVQGNFDTYRMVRMPEAPVVEVYVVPSTDAQGGTGEPGVPPIAPAVCNAIFALTGRRVRKLPIGKLT